MPWVIIYRFRFNVYANFDRVTTSTISYENSQEKLLEYYLRLYMFIYLTQKAFFSVGFFYQEFEENWVNKIDLASQTKSYV